jgi:hypothetical protein
MAEQNLSVDIKIKADTSGAKEAEKAIDGLTEAIEEQAVAEKELVQETEKVVVEEKKLVEVEKEAEKAVEKTTAAKKKKVVEQKKETAAIEEAVVVEKKAIDTTGMYIDAKGRVHEAGGKFVKVAKEEREGLKEQIKLQENSTVTTNGASQAKEKLAKSSNNGAMGVLALSNAFQDAQYGMAGMINNIPMMVSGMGLGMGVAGAAQAAAVGIQILSKNVDLFGEKSKQAARDAADLAVETMADANAAYKSAEATKAATESQERHSQAMQAAEERYKEQIRLSEELIKQRQAEKDAETALADAESGMEMSRIALAEARGEMTKEEAIFAKDKVRVEAESRKQTAAIALEEAKVAEARKKAAAEEAQAQEKRGMALQLTGEGQGMLTKEDRTLAEENRKSAQGQLELSKLRQEEIAGKLKELGRQRFGRGSIENSEKIERESAENRQKLAKEQAEAAKLQADINKEDQRLKKDREAREKTGIKDGDRKDLDKAVQSQFSEAKAGEARAGELRGEAAAGEAGIVRSRQLFGLRQATGAMSALAQVEAERAKQREETAKAREKAGYDMDFMGPIPTGDYLDSQKRAKDRAREAKQVGAAGGSLATTLAGDGLAPGFTDKLREAAGGAGDAAGLDRLMKMVAMLTANTKKLSEAAKSKLDKLEAEIEDLRTAK